MFKRQEVKKEENQRSNYELQIENEKLKIESETLQFKLQQMDEKYATIEKRLKEKSMIDIDKMSEENEELKKEIADLKFKANNDTSNIALEADNKKLNAEIDIQKAENKHLKDLLNTYRSMPDVKNMIDNLSSLAVPHIDELKEFAKILNENKISQLCDSVSESNKMAYELYERMNQRLDIMRGYR